MIYYDEMSEYKEEENVNEKKEKKEKNFGKDQYGRLFEFAANSIPKLANREMRRKMGKKAKQEGK